MSEGLIEVELTPGFITTFTAAELCSLISRLQASLGEPAAASTLLPGFVVRRVPTAITGSGCLFRTLFCPAEAVDGCDRSRLQRGAPVRLLLIPLPDGRRVDVARLQPA